MFLVSINFLTFDPSTNPLDTIYYPHNRPVNQLVSLYTLDHVLSVAIMSDLQSESCISLGPRHAEPPGEVGFPVQVERYQRGGEGTGRSHS